MKIQRFLFLISLLVSPLAALPVFPDFTTLPTTTSPLTGTLAHRITFTNSTDTDLVVVLKEISGGLCKGYHYKGTISQGGVQTIFARDCKILFISLYYFDNMGNEAKKTFTFSDPGLLYKTYVEITGSINNPDTLQIIKTTKK